MGRWMEGRLTQDLRFALRSLARHPGFAATAILTLALGIGATTTIFTVVRSVLFRPLPFPDAERLVQLYEGPASEAAFESGFSVPDFEDWRDASTTLSSMGLYSAAPGQLVLTEESSGEELATVSVSTGFFETLAVPAALGRWPTVAEEDGDPHVVVLSDGFWRRRFGADAGVVGRTLSFEGVPYRVVGVMPAGFTFPQPDVEAWALLSRIEPDETPLHLRPVRFLSAVGRLAPGAGVEESEAELTRIAQELARTWPETNEGRQQATVVPLREAVVGRVSTALLVLFGVVGFTLLISSVNVANLLLARGMGREREFAVRASLGGGGSRLTSQLLTESLVLCLLGGVAGTVLAVFGVPALVQRSGDLLPRAAEIRPDAVVLTFALAISLVTGLLFGSLPARRAGRVDPAASLRVSARSGGSRSLQRTLSALVLSEVALACVLLVGAGLFLRSLSALRTTDPGFEPQGLLAVDLTISSRRYDEPAAFLAFQREALDALRGLPGVTAAGAIRHFPARGQGEPMTEYEDAQRPRPAGAPERPSAQILNVTPGTFAALGIQTVDGRVFDQASPRLSVVINERLAREVFGTTAASGRRLAVGDTQVDVLGVVEDVRQDGLEQPAPPTAYFLNETITRRGMAIVLRTDGDPLTLIGPVRRVFAEMDPLQSLRDIYTGGDVLRTETAVPRFFTLLMGLFAAVALVLAMVGVYGVVSYGVRQRTHEIGVRIALGAGRIAVARQVLERALLPVLAGLGVGLLAALALGGALRSLWYGVGAADPLTYGAVAFSVLVTALLAVAVPVRRATATQPVRALELE